MIMTNRLKFKSKSVNSICLMDNNNISETYSMFVHMFNVKYIK